MKKVIVINPRGIKGDEEYLNGMVSALYKRNDIDVSLYTNFYYEIPDEDIPYKCHRYFFKNSEKMVPSTKRNAVRAAEYINQYLKLINIIKKEKPDVVHIHWSVISKVDPIFFRKIKKYCGKLVYTAHNVLPHINSEKYIKSYGKIYDCADVIIVHGETKDSLAQMGKKFQQYVNKRYDWNMQHYGCPTRLLDITTNPLVALYFACIGEDNSDGAIYIFSVNKRDVRYADSDRIQMLATLAEFRALDQEWLWNTAYKSATEDKFPQLKSGKYQERLVEQFYHAIKRHNAAFEREIVPLDLLTPQFVQPNRDNPRILKQDGAFIISGLDASDKESDNKMRKFLVKEIAIPKESKAQLRKELEYVGINQASLFPEVDKVADYLRKMA